MLTQFIGSQVSLEKIEDLRFNGQHPNDINVGNKFVGELIYTIPTIVVVDEINWQSTSEVNIIERVSDSEFKVYTCNSVYRLTIL